MPIMVTLCLGDIFLQFDKCNAQLNRHPVADLFRSDDQQVHEDRFTFLLKLKSRLILFIESRVQLDLGS